MNELAVIDQTKLDKILARGEKLKILFASPTTVENAQTKKTVSLRLSRIAKLLESKRQDTVKPALDEQRRINAIFKPVIEPIEKLSKDLIKQVSDFVKAEERKENERKALEAKAAAEALIAGKPVEQAPVVKQAPVVSVSKTKFWTYVVMDALLVPRQFLSVDDRKVFESIKAGVRSIPGLKIYEDVRVGRR